MKQSDCIYCQIIAGQLPLHRIYEDDQFLAFLDIHPYVEGHTLVIPKKHYRWTWDLPVKSEDGITIGRYMEVCQIIANHYKSIQGIGYVYSFVFGQQIPHAHIHLLPSLSKRDFDWLFQDFAERRKGQLSTDAGKRLAQQLAVK